MKNYDLARRRAIACLQSIFVGDALAMPVHWYYRVHDIEKQFPGGISKLEAAPEFHPSSIMSLHSTQKGGRGAQMTKGETREIVGEVILKGKRNFWGKTNQHYHQQMRAGENTLNAHCARVVMRSIQANNGHYNKQCFVQDYINFMTADPPLHPDTYAESYHRGFFSNLEKGKPKDQCGAITHDTASIGALVTIAPIVLAERLRDTKLTEVQTLCHEHLFLTHPDKHLGEICSAYVALLDSLLFGTEDQLPQDALASTAKSSFNLDVADLVRKYPEDRVVIGQVFSPACYIDGSWPGVLFLAFKYCTDIRQALLANTNLGGDNVHRGAVLGTLLGLVNGETANDFFDELVDKAAIEEEILSLVSPQ